MSYNYSNYSQRGNFMETIDLLHSSGLVKNHQCGCMKKVCWLIVSPFFLEMQLIVELNNIQIYLQLQSLEPNGKDLT